MTRLWSIGGIVAAHPFTYMCTFVIALELWMLNSCRPDQHRLVYSANSAYWRRESGIVGRLEEKAKSKKVFKQGYQIALCVSLCHLSLRAYNDVTPATLTRSNAASKPPTRYFEPSNLMTAPSSMRLHERIVS